MAQLGYDVMAQIYAQRFTTPYQSATEERAAAVFATQVPASGNVVDIGCGLGHVTADLTRRGLRVIGCDPSASMLSIARSTYPELEFTRGDALLADVVVPISAAIARFSLIHIPPAELPGVFAAWANRLGRGAPVLIAAQSTDVRGPAVEFDHAVAPAWRWHPDELAHLLDSAGFSETSRLTCAPGESQRFPSFHLTARRR